MKSKSRTIIIVSILAACLVIAIAGYCFNKPKSNVTADESAQAYDHYDLALETFDHFSHMGYDKSFCKALTCIMLAESNGDSTMVEFSYMYPDEYAEFLSHKLESNDELLEAYHTYGYKCFEDNVANNDMYRDEDGEFCPGIGLLLWTGPRADELLINDNGDWTDWNYQFSFIDDQLSYLDITPANFEAKNATDAVAELAMKFLGIPENHKRIDEYLEYLKDVEPVVDSF